MTSLPSARGRARAATLTIPLALALALGLSACAGGADGGEPMSIGVADASVIEPVAFDVIAAGDCLGGTGPVDGMVPAVSCDVPGAIPVQAVVVLGQDAPAERPEPTVVSGYALAACRDSVEAYAEDHGGPVEGLLQIAVVSDTEWLGAATPVVCAVAEHG
jgi:hypothetical protein